MSLSATGMVCVMPRGACLGEMGEFHHPAPLSCCPWSFAAMAHPAQVCGHSVTTSSGGWEWDKEHHHADLWRAGLGTGAPEAARACRGLSVLGHVPSPRCGDSSLNQMLQWPALECPHHAHPSLLSECIPVQAACLLPWKHIQHGCPLQSPDEGLQHPAHGQPSPCYTPLQASNWSRESPSLGQIQRGFCSSRCWPAGAALAEPLRDPTGISQQGMGTECLLGDDGAAQLVRGVRLVLGRERETHQDWCFASARWSHPAHGLSSWR